MDRLGDRDHVGSNRPQVLGLVIITAATSGPSRAFERREIDAAARWLPGYSRPDSRRRPRSPGWCRARFRHQHDLARVAARLERRADAQQPHSSPCAPALGLIATPCMPVSVDQPDGELVDQLQRALHRLLTGCSGWMSAKPGSRATFSLRRGLCFIVHEPSGNSPRSIA
jgi:hypothetical protein